ncbi:MAG: hypothetical protein PWR01_4069 [Clostridiales bacterium]|nr:hypothetical protein [Clostridiales bacterium]MDN5282996.1 hypothetical protein [Candidatus Ozemobacter sp.]
MLTLKKLKFTFLFLILVFSGISADAARLFPILVEKANRFGYIDENGELKLKAQFEDARRFSQGFAAVFSGGQWFFIDESGKRVFNRSFADAKSFSEGLAAVRISEHWGYIDTKGEIAISPSFTEAYDFSEGLACVRTGKRDDDTALYGYIGRDGNFVIKPFLKSYDNQFFSAPGKFSQGLAFGWLPAKEDDATERIGFFDRTGSIVLPPAFIEAGEFNSGLAPVSISASLNEGCGFIDKNGRFVIEPDYARTMVFSEGLAAVCLKSTNDDGLDSWGYIDTNARLKIPAKYYLAEPFSNGLARVYIDGYEIQAYIDKNGRIIARSDQLDDNIENASANIVELTPAYLDCSSFLAPSKNGKINYRPENVLDKNISTAWVEGSKGDGKNEWVEFCFNEEQNFKSIKLYNGYQKTSASGANLYYRNLRAAEIAVSTDSGTEKILKLEDKTGQQHFSLDLNGKKLRIKINSVYKTGKEDPDCGFSEISLFGN